MNKSRKIALVTGASQRIGKEICLYLASIGYEIILHYNNSQNEAEHFSEILSQHTKVFKVKADFSQLEQTESLIYKINKNIGEVTLLINNASSFINDDFNNFDHQTFNYNMNVNFISPVILMKSFYNQEFFRYESYGNIINILDYCIFTNPNNFYSYCLSKKSLMNATILNAKLLAPKIKINGIAPGYVMPSKNQDIEHFYKSILSSPLKIGTAIKDIISSIEYILKTDSLTGEIITLDGGKKYTNSDY